MDVVIGVDDEVDKEEIEEDKEEEEEEHKAEEEDEVGICQVVVEL